MLTGTGILTGTYFDSHPCLDTLVDGPDDPVVALAARDELELGGDERVQADVDGVQAGLTQPGQLPTQRQTVRRYSDGPVEERNEAEA